MGECAAPVPGAGLALRCPQQRQCRCPQRQDFQRDKISKSSSSESKNLSSRSTSEESTKKNNKNKASSEPRAAGPGERRPCVQPPPPRRPAQQCSLEVASGWREAGGCSSAVRAVWSPAGGAERPEPAAAMAVERSPEAFTGRGAADTPLATTRRKVTGLEAKATTPRGGADPVPSGD